MTRFVIHNHLPAQRAVDGWVGPLLKKVNGLYLYKNTAGRVGVLRTPHGPVLADFGVGEERKAEEFAQSYKQPNRGHDAAAWVVEFYSGDWHVVRSGSNPRETKGGPFKTEEEAKKAARYYNGRTNDVVLSFTKAQIKAKEAKGDWDWADHPKWDGSEFEVFDNTQGGKKIKVRVYEPTPRDFRGVVNRDQEERNRQESYDRTGIRRVATDEGSFEKGQIVTIKAPKPLPSGRSVKIRGRITYVRPDGKYEVRGITPGMYDGGSYNLSASEIE